MNGDECQILESTKLSIFHPMDRIGADDFHQILNPDAELAILIVSRFYFPFQIQSFHYKINRKTIEKDFDYHWKGPYSRSIPK